jgi:hypothetical protein
MQIRGPPELPERRTRDFSRDQESNPRMASPCLKRSLQRRTSERTFERNNGEARQPS